MRPIVRALLAFLASLFRSRLALQLKILVLRHHLTVYHRSIPRPQVRPCLPSGRRNTGRRVPWLRRPVPALRATPDPSAPSRRRSLSRGRPGYRAYPASAAFATGQGRHLQLRDRSGSPGCPSHPAEGICGVGQAASDPAAFAPDQGTRPSELLFLAATGGSTSVPARGLAHQPADGLVRWLPPVRFLRGGTSSYGGPASSPGGPVSH
jgi:hypothetical protein